MKLNVLNRQKAKTVTREMLKLIEKAMRLCVKKENFKYQCEASLFITDNITIKAYNLEHRGIDKITDVLSFPLLEYLEGEPVILPGDVDPETNRVLLGDIVISVEKAYEQAESYGHSIEREMAFLAIHGMLHLLGYDHESQQEEKTMFQKQDDVLSEMRLGRDEKQEFI